MDGTLEERGMRESEPQLTHSAPVINILLLATVLSLSKSSVFELAMTTPHQ